MFEEAFSTEASRRKLAVVLQRVPLALQRHAHSIRIKLPDVETSPAATLAPPVGGDASEDSPQAFRQGIGMPFILEPLGDDAEMQHGTLALVHIGSRFA